jgi:hypothetical protein
VQILQLNDHTPARGADSAERIFSNAVWLAMSVALLAYVYCFGRNMPYQDDWELVPVLSGATPFSLDWLTLQDLEHRYVLGKSLLYLTWHASGGDFRSSMWVSDLLLIVAAYAYMRVARRIRGSASFSDAFFPLLLLNWGLYESLIFFVQLWFVLPVVIFSVVVFSIVTDAWRSYPGAVVLCVCVLLLPLNGAMGILLTPALLAWLAYAAWMQRRLAIGWPLVIAGVFSAMFAGLYFWHYQSPPAIPKALHTLLGPIRAALEVLCVSLGTPGSDLWPGLAFVIAAACGATGLWLLALALSRREERLRAAGLLACLAAMGLLALGIGYGRNGIGLGSGFSSRYSLLIAPALCLVFLAATLYGGRIRARLVEMTLFVAACVIFVANTRSGLDYAHYRDAPADALLADVAAGVPPSAIGQRYAPLIYPNAQVMEQRLEMMRVGKVGPYKGDAVPLMWPSCHKLEVPFHMVGSNQVTLDGDIGRGLGTDPYIVYALPEPLQVCGIRVHYSVQNDAASPVMSQLFWKLSSATQEFDGLKRNATVHTTPGEQTTMFWIYARIDQFRFDPDIQPGRFQVLDVTFLVAD